MRDLAAHRFSALELGVGSFVFLVLMGFAQDRVPSLSAPTGLQAGNTTAVYGSSFPPGAEITLEIKPPTGQLVRHAVKPDGEGNFTFEFILSQEGDFLAIAKNSEGTELARMTIYSAPRPKGS